MGTERERGKGEAIGAGTGFCNLDASRRKTSKERVMETQEKENLLEGKEVKQSTGQQHEQLERRRSI